MSDNPTPPASQNPYQGLPGYPGGGSQAAGQAYNPAASASPEAGNPAYPSALPYSGAPQDNSTAPVYPNNGYAYSTPTYPNSEPPLDQPWYGIDLINAVKRFFQKYATFSGRASRGEYWWVFLASYVISFAIASMSWLPIGPFIGIVFSLGIIVPTLAVSVRRLHDTNLSGWFLLIPYALAFAGTIVMSIGFVSAGYEMIDEDIDYMTDEAILELFSSAFGGIGIGILLMLIGTVVSIVLMARRSDPRGVRFDKQGFQQNAFYTPQTPQTGHTGDMTQGGTYPPQMS